MKPSTSVLCVLFSAFCLSGCVIVPGNGDRVTVKTDDATVLVLADLDLLSDAKSLPICASVLKSSRIASERVSLENAQSRIPALENKNATAFRGFARGLSGAVEDLKNEIESEVLR